MTPREKAEEIVDAHVAANSDLGALRTYQLISAITTALQEIATETRLQNRIFERRKLVRDVVTNAHNGEHSVKTTQVIEAEIAWPEEANIDIDVWEMAGEWRIVG